MKSIDLKTPVGNFTPTWLSFILRGTVLCQVSNHCVTCNLRVAKSSVEITRYDPMNCYFVHSIQPDNICITGPGRDWGEEGILKEAFNTVICPSNTLIICFVNTNCHSELLLLEVFGLLLLSVYAVLQLLTFSR